MNETSQAIIEFVFGKFIEAAGGEVGGDIASAILQMILGNSSDLSSQILDQIKDLQVTVNNLAAQTSAAVQYGDAHTALHNEIGSIDLIINFTGGQQTNTAHLASVMDDQWTTVIGFLNPGTGSDYASLSSNLLFNVYSVTLNQMLNNDTIAYGTDTACYAYQMNLPLLAENPLFLGDYIANHVQLLISVLADISAVANAAAAALQAVQTVYADKAKFSTLSVGNQQGITQLMSSTAPADLHIASSTTGTRFYTTAAACLQNAPATLCANAYTDFGNLTNKAQVSIMNTDIAAGMYLVTNNDMYNASDVVQGFGVTLSAAAPPLSLWQLPFTDGSCNSVNICNVGGPMPGGYLYDYGCYGYLTPSKTDFGTNAYFTPSAPDFVWYLQLWGTGEPASIKFNYRLVNNGSFLVPVATHIPGTFNVSLESDLSLFSLVW